MSSQNAHKVDTLIWLGKCEDVKGGNETLIGKNLNNCWLLLCFAT